MKEKQCGCNENMSSPCGIVIFGASGDLTHRKLLPALFSLFKNKLLNPKFYILGVARTTMSNTEFRDKVYNIVMDSFSKVDETVVNKFVKHCYYLSGDYQELGLYNKINDILTRIEGEYKTGGNRLYYCATPPQVYKEIICLLKRSGLSCNKDECVPLNKVIVEKPFGYDLESAKELENRLSGSLQENQIYRIDHYLGKETVQNILMLRFANALFEPLWNSNYIDHIQITTSETIGVGHRASYFESAGILRDMFQNHMLQLLALVAMEPPTKFNVKQLRDEKNKLISSIKPFSEEDIEKNIVRGQYTTGIIDNLEVPPYRQESGVKSDSQTETFVALKLFIENWRWHGVPFYVRVGKRLKERLTEISIVFKKVPHSIFAPFSIDSLESNVLSLTVQPKEGIAFKFLTKKPGPKTCLMPAYLDFCYKDMIKTNLPEAYERLLLDCMNSDQTLFIRNDCMELSWELMMPILDYWNSSRTGCPLYSYTAGSWGPEEANNLIINDNRKWLLSKQDS